MSLSPGAGRFVESMIRAGRYGSADEVLDRALGLMQEHEALRHAQLKRLRADADSGLRALRNGEAAPFDDAALARIRAKGLRLLHQRRRAPTCRCSSMIGCGA